MFLADVLGIYDVYPAVPATALERRGAGAGERPADAGAGDGLMPRSTWASASPARCPTSTRIRSPGACRTLDHLTQRADRLEHRHRLSRTAPPRAWAWPRQPDHDTRYEIAEDYMQVVYKLWEGSWEDGAVLRDRAARRFADPEPHPSRAARRAVFPDCRCDPSVPSPRRSARRCCIQAGASTRGRAVRRRPCRVRVHQRPVEAGGRADRRRHPRRAAAAGRDPREITIFTMMTVITDTDAGSGARQATPSTAPTRASRAASR